MDPGRVNGGVFLGLDGVVIKSHGGADAESYAGAIEVGYDMVRQELLAQIREMIGQTNEARGPPAVANALNSPSSRGTPDCMIAPKLRSVVRGVGAYLPERVLTNAELAKIVDTSDEWIQQRTGIRQRYIAGEGETTSRWARAPQKWRSPAPG